MADRMPERDPVALDDRHALATLDNHYALQLHCSSSDLRRAGWTLTTASGDPDPVALLFGQRMLLTLIAPAHPNTAPDDAPNRAGVALVARELREIVGDVLRHWSPTTLFTPSGRGALDLAVRTAAPRALPAGAEAHTRLHYAIPGSFRPYLGQWLDWIELLDESTEMDPAALSLLARYSGGIYVVRERGRIVAYAAMRAQSPAVCELHVRTLSQALRGHGLGRAVAARATRAILDAGRVPLFAHQARDLASQRLAAALGYRLYAQAMTYTTELA